MTSSSGQELYAIEAGTGTRALVLVHGSGARGLCNWAAEVPWLAAAGFRVIAFDAACVGASTCAADVARPIDDVIAVVDEAKRRGATDVVVVAASAGGPLAVQVAARTDADVRATVALSPAGLSTDWDEPDAVAERTIDAAAVAVVPIMYALATDDSAATVAEISALQRASSSAGAIFEKLPAGSGHAQQTLYDESGEAPSAFRSRLLAFLKRLTTP